ncbi:MAG: BspA family leucine-rich repeat surface protein, partial [Eubacterium sp.]|nr:BspA family leucine-rich repeat surface protein [Eubacterium sp.]
MKQGCRRLKKCILSFVLKMAMVLGMILLPFIPGSIVVHAAEDKIPIAYYCDGNKTLYLLMDTQSNYNSATTYKGQIITHRCCDDDVTRYGMEDQEPNWNTELSPVDGNLYIDNEVIEHIVIESSFANVKVRSFYQYFSSNNLRDISGLGYLNTSKAMSMAYMFSGCKYLTTLDLRNFNTSSVWYMNNMFDSCVNLEHIYYTQSKFITKNVTKWNDMFQECYKLPGFRFDSDDGDRISLYMEDPEGFNYYVAWCEGNKTIYFLGQYGQLNAGDTYKNQEITSVYSGIQIIDGDAPWKDHSSAQYVVFESSFSYARPKNISDWFIGFGSLISISGLEYLNTSQVVYMQSVFENCSKLTTIDLSHFNTSNVINMRWMFEGCDNIEILDLSSFNTAKVQEMTGMFNRCNNLKTIIVGTSWSTRKVSISDLMFSSCNNLVGCEGTRYDGNYEDKTYARVDDGPNRPGYLSDGKTPATAPTISTQPVDTSIEYGTTGDISISAVAAIDTEYNLSYQWYSNNSNTNEGGEKINGATSATYVLPNDKAVGDYYFYCEVTATRKDNSKKKYVRSSAATVTVTQKAVTVKANDQTVELNGNLETGTGQATLTGAVDGHTLDSVTLTFDPDSTANATISGTIMPSNAVIKNSDTDVTSNYNITYAAGTLTVSKADSNPETPTGLTAT